MKIKEEITNYLKELGLLEIGFCRCETFYEMKELLEKRRALGFENEFEEDDINKRIDPKVHMEDGKTIISIAFPYLFNLEKQENIYFSKYTMGKDYHKVVSYYLKKLCEFIEKLGGKAKYFVDSNALPERYIALKSGLGFIGKNNMLINNRYGSYVFLGEVITDLYIEENRQVVSGCGSCEDCLKACPTKAISKDQICNTNICLSYITQKKHIEDKWLNKLGGRLFGCDTCQNVCPYNKEIEFSNLEEFRPFEFMEKVNAKELININKQIFKEKYSNTSSGWRGKNTLQRNALINLIMNKNLEKLGGITINSPYVEEYYHRLLKYNKL